MLATQDCIQEGRTSGQGAVSVETAADEVVVWPEDSPADETTVATRVLEVVIVEVVTVETRLVTPD